MGADARLVGHHEGETRWQQQSVRGFFAGAVRKKLGLTLVSEKLDGERVYRIVSTQSRKSTDGSQDHVTIGPSQTAPGIAASGLRLAPPSNRPVRSGVPVKVHAVCGRRDEPGTYHKGAQPLPRFALGHRQ